MMGREGPLQSKLFYTDFNLEQRIRKDHPLRHLSRRIDFDFAYQEVADQYGANGNVSFPPPVILVPFGTLPFIGKVFQTPWSFAEHRSQSRG